jgi:hypothetical protein
MIYNNKKQNCTLADNGTIKNNCLNGTGTQCAYEKLTNNGNPISNPSFENYYYPWCYYKPDSYMLFSNNRKINCRLPCNDINCHEKDLGFFNSDGTINTSKPRKNSLTNENYNWCFYKNQQNKFKSPSIE